MVGNLVQYVVDPGATYYVLTVLAGQLAPWNLLYYTRKTKSKIFHHPSNLHLGKTLIMHKLLVMPECPSPLLGKGVSLSLGDNFYSPQKPKPRNVSGCTMYYYIRHGQFSPKYPPEIGRKKKKSPDLELGNPRESKVCHACKDYLKEGYQLPFQTSVPSLSSKLYVSLHLFLPWSHFSFFSTPTRRVILAVHVGTAPAYRRPPFDTMSAADKVANSSDCWICLHSHVTPEDSCLLGLPTSFRDLMGLTAKHVVFSFTTPCSKEGRAGAGNRWRPNSLKQKCNSKSEGKDTSVFKQSQPLFYWY